MAIMNTLRLSRPAILEDLAAYYNEHLRERLAIEELVGMMVFIEYFATEEDRDVIRASYFTDVANRFARHDLGRKPVKDVLMDAVFNEAPIGIRPKMIARSKGYYVKETILSDMDPTIKPTIVELIDPFQANVGGLNELMRYQKAHQNIFLGISEYIERLYIAIRQYYFNSGHHQQLKSLSGICYGGVPKISSATCTHIDIQVTLAEVY